MRTSYTHYDFCTDIVILFNDGTDLVLENITDVWLDELGHFVTFRDYYGDETVVSHQQIRYFRPN